MFEFIKLNRMMKIAILTRSTPHHLVGGMEIISWNLAKKFVQKDHQVEIITTSIPNKPSTFIEEGITIVSLTNTQPGKYSNVWWDKSVEYFLTKNPNIVFSISAGAYGLLSHKSDFSMPFVLQIHGTSWGEILAKIRTNNPLHWIKSLKNFYTLPLDLSRIPKFDSLVAVGPRVTQDLQSFPFNIVVNPKKVKTITNGVDTNLFRVCSSQKRFHLRKILGLSQNSKILITASRIHAQKGIENILHSFLILLKERKNLNLVIVGDGPNRENLERFCCKFRISENVIFTGLLSQEDLSKFLNASDLFLFLTNHREGLPLNILEALSTGLNCIISDHLDIFESEMIHKINPKDFRKVSEKISYLLDQEAVVASSIPENYTLDYSADQYLQLFESLRSNY